MTSPRKRPTLRSVRLNIHPAESGTSWALILRTDDGRTVFDRRLHSGHLDAIGRVQGPSDLSGTLRAVADEIDRRWAPSPASGGREPRGAVGGGMDQSHANAADPPPPGPSPGQWVDVPLPLD